MAGERDLTRSMALAKGRRPYFFSDLAMDKLLAITMALVGELSVTRDRLDTVERLLASTDVLSREEIESWRPDEAAKEERGRSRQDYVARVLMILQNESGTTHLKEADEQYEALQAWLAESE